VSWHQCEDREVGRLDDDDDSLDPNFTGGLWEYQLTPLTVRELRRALDEAAEDLPVEVEHYDGTGDLQKLRPMHIDLRGFEGHAEAVVIVVH
jgi:hypothetical protein